MSVHKDKKTGKWYVSCRYDNWDGARKQKMKRGFETKREAQSWEREFLQIKKLTHGIVPCISQKNKDLCTDAEALYLPAVCMSLVN